MHSVTVSLFKSSLKIENIIIIIVVVVVVLLLIIIMVNSPHYCA